MNATLTIRLSIEMAQLLDQRVAALRAKARARHLEVEKKLKAAASEEERYRLRELLEVAKEVEADMNVTNLVKALLTAGIENCLSAPDESLMTLLHSVKSQRGRPPK